jgi:hypothetical protein
MASDHDRKPPESAAQMCALVCPNCSQLWLTSASFGEQFRCRECQYAFRAGEDSPLSPLESLRARPDRTAPGASAEWFVKTESG